MFSYETILRLKKVVQKIYRDVIKTVIKFITFFRTKSSLSLLSVSIMILVSSNFQSVLLL